MCRNGDTQLEEQEQELISGQVGHTSQEEVLTCEESQDIYNLKDVQKEEEECISNEHRLYAIVSQDAEEEWEGEILMFNLAVPLMKISSKISE